MYGLAGAHSLGYGGNLPFAHGAHGMAAEGCTDALLHSITDVMRMAAEPLTRRSHSGTRGECLE